MPGRLQIIVPEVFFANGTLPKPLYTTNKAPGLLEVGTWDPDRLSYCNPSTNLDLGQSINQTEAGVEERDRYPFTGWVGRAKKFFSSVDTFHADSTGR